MLNKKFLTLWVLLITSFGVLLTVSIAQKNQEVREHAASSTTSYPAVGTLTNTSIPTSQISPIPTLISSTTPPFTSTNVTVDTTQHFGTIEQNYVGLSIEEGDVCKLLQVEASHPELDTFLKNLSPLVLRIGGNSSDQTTWNPTATCSGSNTIIGTVTIDGIFTLARKTNMKIIWGVNLKANQPSIFAQEAAYVIQSGGNTLLGIELGNEPNDYGGITYPMYKADWESYYSAIKTASPNAPIVGPDTSGLTCATCTSSSFFGQFLRDEGKKITFVTLHYYPLNQTTANIQNLLSQTTMTALSTHMEWNVAAAKAQNIPSIIDESNSVSGGGASGVSDVFASSLWGLDYMFTAAETGVSGIEFHGSAGTTDGYYTPIGLNPSGIYAKPLYYALLLFHNLVQGGTIVQTNTTSPINLTSHAVITTDGKLQIVLINKDQTTDTNADVTIPSGYLSGSEIRLQAPAVTSFVKDVTLGGSTITNNGFWNPSIIESVQITNNAFSITVPHASAVAITLSQPPLPSASPTNAISFFLTICPHGLGNCGDNVSSSSGGNSNPLDTTRNILITLTDTNNNQALNSPFSGQVTYVSSSQNFLGTISIPNLSNGQYLVTVKLDGFLRKQISGIVRVTHGQTVALPAISVVNGDINNDNQLDIQDYNILLSCFGSKFTTSFCLNKRGDLDDDGIVDGADYNLFLRELSVQKAR